METPLYVFSRGLLLAVTFRLVEAARVIGSLKPSTISPEKQHTVGGVPID